jgi:hypothetical protein
MTKADPCNRVVEKEGKLGKGTRNFCLHLDSGCLDSTLVTW